MNSVLLIFTISLFFAGCISLFIGFYMRKKEKSTGQQFFKILMVLISVYCFTYIFELISPSEFFSFRWANIKFISISLIPPTFFFFTYYYFENKKYIDIKKIFIVYLFPIINIGLAHTNPYHNLYWISREAIQTDIGFFINSIRGPFFWFHVIYCYIFLAIGFIYIIKSLFKSRSLYSKQALLLILGISAPIIGNIISIIELSPLFYDVTPLFFVLTGIFFSLAIFQYRLFKIAPIARETIVEYLSEAIFVLDKNFLIVDFNKSAEQLIFNNYIVHGEKEILGLSAKLILKDICKIIDVNNLNIIKTEVTLSGLLGEKIFEIEQSLISREKKNIQGYTLIFRDVTIEKNRELKEKNKMSEINRYQKAISYLSKHQNLLDGNKQKTFEIITETAARELKISQVSIWFFQNNQQRLVCSNLYNHISQQHSKGMRMDINKYPLFFEILKKGRIITASDAHSDENTKELKDEYLKPNHIVSLMDVPIWISGNIVGVLCLEQISYQRKWLDYEMTFAKELTNQIAQVDLNAEKMHAVIALQGSEVKYRTIFENTGTAIGTFSESGLITMVNSEFEKLSGYSKKEIENHMYWFEFISENDKKTMLGYQEKRTKGDKDLPSEYDFSFINKDGYERSAHITISMIPHTQMRIFSLIDTTDQREAEEKMIDVQNILKNVNKQLDRKVKERTSKLQQTQTELKKLNESLEQKVEERTNEVMRLLKEKEEFINRLSHDLKNPIGPIVNLLPLVIEDIDDPVVLNDLEVVQRNAIYMKELIMDSLNLARFEKVGHGLDEKEMNMFELVETVIDDNRFYFNDTDLSIKNEMDKDIVIFADELKIKEVLNNLLSNAIRYKNHDSNSIVINAVKENDNIHFSIRDQGIGLTQKQISKIFNEFYKADYSRHVKESSGLGLTICKKIIEKHDGKIWAESDGVGKGSTFHFTLPAFET